MDRDPATEYAPVELRRPEKSVQFVVPLADKVLNRGAFLMRQTLVVLLSFTLSLPVFADRIVLIYGDVLEGRVVSQTDSTLTIQGPFGERIMNKSDIRE